MKINSILKKGLLVFAMATSIISCSDDEKKPVDNTITGVASSNRNFDILVEALKEVQLDRTLQGQGPFTVFAPTDEAFLKFLRKTPYESVDKIPKDVLKQILLNHVVSGKFPSTGLATGYVKTLATNTFSGTNTMSMYVEVNPTTKDVMLNGFAKVETADIMASNGIIHVVDKVIDLPTIVTHATANKNFSSLVGALTGKDQPDFVGILSGTSPYTVFAPTNDAFTNLNTELAPSGIAGVSIANLTKVLQYHVVNGSVLSGSLKEGLLPTLLKQNFSVSLTGGPKIIDFNKRTSNVIAADVQCSNGVIHVLDKVLLPKL